LDEGEHHVVDGDDDVRKSTGKDIDYVDDSDLATGIVLVRVGMEIDVDMQARVNVDSHWQEFVRQS
jgi:hypothetical protein